jgi:transcription initiation factor TFIID subunit 7
MASNGLKLKLNIGSSINQAPSASTPTPSTATPGGTKFKLKFNNKASTPSTPAPTPADEAPKPKKTKAGRAPKPSAKVVESRKRSKEDSDAEDEDGGTIQVQRPAKKIKLQLNPSGPKTPITPSGQLLLKAKVRGKPPKRTLGEGYDSEASDRELDPTIEEEFILRMMPGDDCDYLRQAIADKKIGLPKGPPHYGADVYLKFYNGDGRRASVTIRGKAYAATLVDLPCVIEGMKSWDKRGWWKSADICQMLWVFAEIKNEAEAKTIPLPSIVDPVTYQYPHGLTPPMHFARKRRFRKRVHKSQIEAVEAAVDRLLQADAEAESSTYMIIDPEAEERHASQAWSPEGSQGDYEAGGGQYSQDEDAEGEADDAGDYFSRVDHNTHVNASVKEEFEDDGGLAMDLEAAFNADLGENQSDGHTPLSTAIATPSQLAASTPAAEPSIGEEDSGDESFESEDEADDSRADEDPDEIARLAQIQGIREDIANLEQAHANVKNTLLTTTNVLLKRRMEESLKKLTSEIELKKSSLGEGDED